ncbi:hypothetical protein HBA55_35020 [Pseudomaricurvus alkylphenolicus]|uniref:hypothetical protein n=1 Tax=Pseudomaricurvus alkylphenolicus TaxID=1306991 RepID=UPI001423D305|nr:hypothetical protein [Pseudomaricurvus alkylphenolicus]NIB44846.1 hypothetical protein [Pseudomaricurvus alkylphenolicus]
MKKSLLENLEKQKIKDLYDALLATCLEENTQPHTGIMHLLNFGIISEETANTLRTVFSEAKDAHRWLAGQITILVDELEDSSPFVVCHRSNKGAHSILEAGKISNPEELRAMQERYKGCKVQIDCAFMGTDMQYAAQHYHWKLVKFRKDDFPFIEAMTQLGSI